MQNTDRKLKPELFQSDLSAERLKHYLKKQVLAVDTETRGLVIRRDRLCLVQLCDDEDVVSVVRYTGPCADNLKRLLSESSITKVFHFARFDVAVLKHYLNVDVQPIWCTKIVSKLVRTYTDRHSLKDLGKELLNIEIDKTDQMSDWAKEELTETQLAYAANDVRVLIPIQRKMHKLLLREGLVDLAQHIFDFIPVVCELDLRNYRDVLEH